MRSLNLDSLLGQRHQDATFHDAELQSFHIDFESGSVNFQFMIPCGLFPKAEQQYYGGTLEFTGILFCFVQAMAFSSEANDKQALWITSNGPLPDERVELAIELPRDLPEDAFIHYFYSDTTNSFVVFAATHEVFRWQ